MNALVGDRVFTVPWLHGPLFIFSIDYTRRFIGSENSTTILFIVAKKSFLIVTGVSRCVTTLFLLLSWRYYQADPLSSTDSVLSKTIFKGVSIELIWLSQEPDSCFTVPFSFSIPPEASTTCLSTLSTKLLCPDLVSPRNSNFLQKDYNKACTTYPKWKILCLFFPILSLIYGANTL